MQDYVIVEIAVFHYTGLTLILTFYRAGFSLHEQRGKAFAKDHRGSGLNTHPDLCLSTNAFSLSKSKFLSWERVKNATSQITNLNTHYYLYSAIGL